MTQGDAREIQMPTDQEVYMWGYIDTPYLQQMTGPERITVSIVRVVYFA